MTADIAQGYCCDFTQVAPAERQGALENACDYRGDITLELADGSRLDGYIFDVRAGQPGQATTVRLMLASTGEKVTVAGDRIHRLTFSGKDTAAGKTFDAWIQRYIQKRLAGERASIESEPLDDGASTVR
jgi:transcriptional antiterminator Rof (Rho-off)